MSVLSLRFYDMVADVSVLFGPGAPADPLDDEAGEGGSEQDIDDIDLSVLQVARDEESDEEITPELVARLQFGIRDEVAQVDDGAEAAYQNIGALLLPAALRATGSMDAPANPPEPDHHERLKILVNEESVNWHGYQFPLESDRPTVAHPMTNTLRAMQRRCWGQSTGDDNKKLYAQALVQKALEEGIAEQVHNRLQSVKLEEDDSKKVLLWSLRQDSTTQLLRFSEAQRAVRLGWLKDALARDTALEPEDRERLVQAFATQRQGLVHVLTTRARLRWGLEPEQSESIPCRCSSIESTNAACIQAGTFQAVPGIEILENVREMAPVVPCLMLHVGSDRASGDERMQAQVSTILQPLKNVLLSWRFCATHDSFHIAEEVAKQRDVTNRCFQWVKLLRDTHYVDSWCFGISKKIAQVDIVTDCTPDGIARARAESDPIVDRLCRMAVLYKYEVSAGDGRESQIDTIKQRIQFFKQMWHFRSDNFKAIRHCCNYQNEDACPCTNESSCIYNMADSFMQLFLPLVPSGELDVSSWGAIQGALAMVLFSTMCGYVGPAGWADRWPRRVVDVLAAAHRLDADADPQGMKAMQMEKTKRLSGVTRTVTDEDQLVFMTQQAVVLRIVDKLMKAMQAADTEDQRPKKDNTKQEMPFLYSLFFEDTSPVVAALKELHDITLPGGDLYFLTELWWKATGSKDEFWQKWRHEGNVMALNQSAGIRHVLGSRALTYPTRAFSPYAYWHRYGREHSLTLDHADEVHAEPRCCKEPDLAEKLHDMVPDGRGLLFGPAAPTMYAVSSSGEIRETNDDLERDQAVNNIRARTRNPPHLSALCRQLPLRRARLEHQKRNGTLDYHLSRAKLDNSGLDIRKKVKHEAKGKGANKQRRPTAYALFLSVRAREYRATQQPSAAVLEASFPQAALGAPQQPPNQTSLTQRPTRSGKRPVRKKSVALRVFSKGKWAVWKTFLQGVRDDWKNNTHIQALYKAKRIFWKPKPKPVRKTKAALKPSETWWGIGDVDGPCSMELLQRTVAKHHKPLEDGVIGEAKRGEWLPGPTNCGKRIHETELGSFMIRSPIPVGTKLPPLKRRKTCWEKYPGICPIRDALVFDQSRRICLNLNTLFSTVPREQINGKFLRFSVRTQDVDHPEDEDLHFMDIIVARVRYARPIVQYFAGLAPADVTDDGPKEGRLQQTHRSTFNVVSSYTAIKSLVLRTLYGYVGPKQCVLTSVSVRAINARLRLEPPGTADRSTYDLTTEPPVLNVFAGKTWEIFPDMLPKNLRKHLAQKAQAAEEADPNFVSPLVKAAMAGALDHKRVKALEKWAKKVYAGAWKKIGGMAHLSADGRGRGLGRGRGAGADAADPAPAQGGAKGGRGGRGRGGKGAGRGLAAAAPILPAPADDAASSDSDASVPAMDWEDAEFDGAGGAPADPVAAAGPGAAAALAAGGPRGVTTKYPYACGLLLWDPLRKSIDAHCYTCGLALSRSVERRLGAAFEHTMAQGRPMGGHLVLLEGCPGNEQSHRARWNIKYMTFAKRHQQRSLQRGNPYLQDLFSKERKVRDEDVDGEPRGLW